VTVIAPPSKQKVAQNWYVLPSLDGLTAGGAGRAWKYDGPAKGKAIYADIDKAPQKCPHEKEKEHSARASSKKKFICNFAERRVQTSTPLHPFLGNQMLPE